MLTDAPATSVSPPAILSPFAQMNTSSSSGDVEAFAAKLYTEMVDDLVQDLTFLAVKSMKRARQPCSVCHTNCQTDHGSAPSTSKSQSANSSKTALADAGSGHKPMVAGAGASSKVDTTLSCLNCDRPIASTRYAHHLSSCMGLGNSRRGAVRSSAQKQMQETEVNSPYVESDSGGEESKGKHKSLGDLFKLDSKSKKRPFEGKPKPSPKKQKVSPIKAVIPQHVLSGGSAVPQVKGTGPPRRPAPALLPLRTGPMLGAPIAPPISASSSITAARSLAPHSSKPSRSSTIPSRLGTSAPSVSSETSSNSSDRPRTPVNSGPSRPTINGQTKPGSYLDQYTSKQAGFPNGTWLHNQKPVTAPVPYVSNSPPHADADELVDTDSSEDDD